MKLPQQLDDPDILDGSPTLQQSWCSPEDNSSLKLLKLPSGCEHDDSVSDISANTRQGEQNDDDSVVTVVNQTDCRSNNIRLLTPVTPNDRTCKKQEDDYDEVVHQTSPSPISHCKSNPSVTSGIRSISKTSAASGSRVFVSLEHIVEERRSTVTMQEDLHRGGLWHLAHKVEWAAMVAFSITTICVLVLWDLHEHQAIFVCSFLVTAVAALTYLNKVTIGDFMFQGTKVPVARYLDWIITTPLMLEELCHLGHAPAHTSIMIIGCDILMIICGIISALISWERKGLKHVWFVIASAFYIIWLYCLHVDVGNGSAQQQPEHIQRLFKRLEVLTISTWSWYPIVVLLGRAQFKVITRPMEDILLSGLDILSKIGMEFLIILSYQLKF